ncbi:MAG: hypothetical protein NTV54_07695 [Ignavibacteriales bacterium]|nr:hypothetical protein [Ignavibacteriales bacterium]
MKKQTALLVLCMCVLMQRAAFSQGAYFKAGGSYRLGLPSMLIDENYTSTSSSTGSTSKTEGVYGSFGNGLGFDGAIGYKGENLGIEVGVSYLLKSSIEATSKYNSASSVSNTTYTYEGTMLAISPCFVFATSVGFYGRAGAVLGFPKFASKRHGESPGSLPVITDAKTEYSGNMALGFTGAVGVAVGNGAVKLYIEADVVSLTWAPASSEITEYTADGKDQLPAMKVYDKKTNYEETITYNSSAVVNRDVERVSLKNYMPFSSLGLKAGIMIGF